MPKKSYLEQLGEELMVLARQTPTHPTTEQAAQFADAWYALLKKFKGPMPVAWCARFDRGIRQGLVGAISESQK